MGKSVVGIFAIALFQIAFLGYIAVDGMRNAVIGEVAAPVMLEHELARLDDTPEFPPREPVQVRRIHRPRTVTTNKPQPTAPTYDSRLEWVAPIASTTIIRSGPGIPSGYSMVLVDYSPDVLVNGKPKETRFR